MRAFIACACFLLGAVCLAVLPELHRREGAHFSSVENCFSYPIPLRSNMVLIRRDTEGKGDFGATRGSDSRRKHEGVDLLVPLRYPIYAAKSGRVLVAGIGKWSKGYGKYVEIVHPDGRVTRYAHLSNACVLEGDWVRQGQVIGVSGKTGNAAGRRVHPHLHFEIREQGKALNPSSFLDPRTPMR